MMGNDFDRRADSHAGAWRTARLASKPTVVLLPKRRAELDPGDSYGHPAVIGLVLRP